MKNRLYNKVNDFYKKNFDKLKDKQFHFASRLYLYNKNFYYSKKLKKIELKLFNDKIIPSLTLPYTKIKNIKHLDQRQKYLDKYPQLIIFHDILLKSVYYKSVYQKSVKKFTMQLIKKDKIETLVERLLKDEECIVNLSTYAITFLFLYFIYYKKHKFNLKKIISLPKNKLNIKKQKKILNKLEDIILSNYFNIELDTKFEFLVCCKICETKSRLEKIIFNEASHSLSKNQNYIIDKYNVFAKEESFYDSEHRNVLYLMANLQYKPQI